MASVTSKLEATSGKLPVHYAASHPKLDGRKSPTPDFDSKTASKPGHGQPYLDIPLQEAFRPSIDTLSTYSADNENERSTARSLHPNLERIASRSPAPPRTLKGKWTVFWERNKGLALVLLSQFFGGLMNVATRILEVDATHGAVFSPFQILFVRMSITTICCFIYMWWAGVKNAPFGKPEVRLLLVLRGLTGFVGVYGIYYCLMYLPLAEATVITFLAPIIACWACSFLVHEPFTRIEQIAAFLSLVGVVLIAQPSSVFGTSTPSTSTVVDNKTQGVVVNGTSPSQDAYSSDAVTSTHRLLAVCVGLLGACGSAGAFTSIRWIGNRAHPLLSVNYFAVWCTIVSFIALVIPGGAEFRLPSTVRDWSLLMFLGICGFVMQFLLTSGLAYEKSSRPTQMVYMQMLFALTFDKIIWGITPGLWSLAGSSLILGSALYVAVKSDTARAGVKAKAVHADEEVGLITGMEHVEEVEEGEDARGLLRGIQEVQLRVLRI